MSNTNKPVQGTHVDKLNEEIHPPHEVPKQYPFQDAPKDAAQPADEFATQPPKPLAPRNVGDTLTPFQDAPRDATQSPKPFVPRNSGEAYNWKAASVPAPQMPTVGRIVHFQHHMNAPLQSAMVVKAWDANVVNLIVFRDGDNDAFDGHGAEPCYWYTSTPLVNDDDKQFPNWQWPTRG